MTIGPGLRTMSLAGAMLCCAPVLRADIVAVSGKPLAVAVDIVALRDGELHYRLFSGDVMTEPIQNVLYLQRIQWKSFNWAEKLLRDGKYAQAVDAYREALKELEAKRAAKPGGDDTGPSGADPLDRRLLVQCRLALALDADNRFVETLEAYLAVIERMPACLATLRPKDTPAAGTPVIEQAVRILDPAIHRHRSDAIGASLRAWRATWAADVPLTYPRKPEPPPVIANREPETKPAEVIEPPPTVTTTEPEPAPQIVAEPPPVATRPAITQDIKPDTGTTAHNSAAQSEQPARDAATDGLSAKIKQGRFDDALATVEDRLADADLVERVGLYYWRGIALAERARTRQGDDAAEDRRSAGLAFMRVVIHAPRVDLAPECLFRAAQLCHDADQRDQARGLWSELVETYPDAQPWVDRARRNLEEIGAATP